MACRVHLLDGSMQIFHVPFKSMGQVLFDEVVRHVQLLEADYFDLEYMTVEKLAAWLDREKLILKQVTPNNLIFRFLVKFYTPDPVFLEDEYTRYLFALQIKQDLASGSLYCQEHTAVLLASYIVQAEMGDFVEEEYPDHSYLLDSHLLPNQTAEILAKIMEHHREHVGFSPAEADFNLLDTARKVEFYGIRLHPARDHENVCLDLAVTHMGVLVFQNKVKINTFSWAKIRKLSFKRRKFLIKLHQEGYGFYKDTVEFYFDNRNGSKNFWKKCIEHHSFFRCHAVKRMPRHKTRVVSRGSSFRYTGRTQKQLVEWMRENYLKRPPFERSTSLRTVSTSRSVGATPKTGTLNSRDFQPSRNTSASSGSHILDTRRSFENVRMIADDRLASNPAMNSSLPLHQLDTANDPLVSAQGYQAQEVNFQAPLLSVCQLDLDMSLARNSVGHDSTIPRSPEVENIPFNVDAVPDSMTTNMSEKNFQRTQSAALVQNGGGSQQQGTIGGSASTNQLPSPTFQGEDDLPPIYPRHSSRADASQTGKSVTTSAASFTLTSTASITSSHGTEDSEDDHRKKKFPADKAYYVAKELLMTERTYKKDLEIVTVLFREATDQLDSFPSQISDVLFNGLGAIYKLHCALLKEIEQRLTVWEGKSSSHMNSDVRKIGDLFLNNMHIFQQRYSGYLDQLENVLVLLDESYRSNRQLEQAIKDFEVQKVCYLPLTALILKPVQRLLHYQLLLHRLLSLYADTHIDYANCQASVDKISEIMDPQRNRVFLLENLQKLIELQKDLSGVDGIAQADREFIREGCLQKLSRKGYQQRMFFLFSDSLLYASRMATPSLQFKVHGQLSLKNLLVEESEQKAIPNSFTVYSGNRCLVLAASTAEERDKWLEDLQNAIAAMKDTIDVGKVLYPSLKSNNSTDNLSEVHDDSKNPPTPERQLQHRANATVHVCWHRNTSVGANDYRSALENQLSGYLLRKFKNSNGWQKLWVVFTNFCLFFYKSFQDEYPLASLPLLGYSASAPSEEDNINKDHVFKLQFKNHVYFFRAESEYTFERWMEVVSSATSCARRTRTFSRMESYQQ